MSSTVFRKLTWRAVRFAVFYHCWLSGHAGKQISLGVLCSSDSTCGSCWIISSFICKGKVSGVLWAGVGLGSTREASTIYKTGAHWVKPHKRVSGLGGLWVGCQGCCWYFIHKNSFSTYGNSLIFNIRNVYQNIDHFPNRSVLLTYMGSVLKCARIEAWV